jgi:hypothetical protein
MKACSTGTMISTSGCRIVESPFFKIVPHFLGFFDLPIGSVIAGQILVKFAVS